MRAFLKAHRWARILWRVYLILMAVIVVVFIAAVLFLHFWPAFGRPATKTQQESYAQRADNFSDGVFHNTRDFSVMSESTDLYANRIGSKGTSPADELPVVVPDLLTQPGEDDLTVTWFGHSTCLLQMQGMNILFDPVFSDIASPVSFIGSWRFSDLALSAEQLPGIDLVIISHDHYDHLDMGTIQTIESKVDHYIVPLGIENDLERWGVPAEKIEAVAWWDEVDLNGLTVACAPSRHYSGRGIGDRNRTLWASWILVGSHYKIYESGDSGDGGHFSEIYEKYGDFDLALMDCAQYNTAWHDVHMFPEEAVDAANTLHAKAAMPIHWGAFQLSDHPWDDPAERFVRHAEETGLEVLTPQLGETVTWEDRQDYHLKWWRDLQ